MSAPEPSGKKLSFLLDKALKSRSPNLAAAILHTPLLKTGILARFHLKLFLCYAVVSGCRNFPNLHSLLSGDPLRWNAAVSSLVRRGFPSLAGGIFSAMHGLGLPLCSYSLCSTLAAAAVAKAAPLGKQVHAYSLKSGWASAIFLGGALVNLYVKLGAIHDARNAFDEIPQKNPTCANTLLMGYVDAKLWPESLALVQEMVPDEFTLSAALKMCADMPAAGLGKQIHALLLRREDSLREDALLLSLLVEMYGNCGLVEDARRAFEAGGAAASRDVVLWTSMLNVYSRNGKFGEVVRTFDEMVAQGTAPDGVAFVAVLSACSRTVDLAGGLAYFRSMRDDHGISPWPEHYGCVVHLLCAAGQTGKAWELAETVVSPENGRTGGEGERIWGALLAACSEIGDVEMGRRAAQRALQASPSNAGIVVELSNLYARRGMWAELEILRKEMNQRRLKKEVGYSWVEETSSYDGNSLYKQARDLNRRFSRAPAER